MVWKHNTVTGTTASRDAAGHRPILCTRNTTIPMGQALKDDRALFELLTLEGCQAGLSWITVLRKREHYRKVYDGFDPKRSRATRQPSSPSCWPIPASSATRARSRRASATPRLISRWSSARVRSPSSCGASSAASRRRTTARASRKCPRRHPKAMRWPRRCRRPASSSSARRSAMPSCRRPAWSTTISWAAIGHRDWSSSDDQNRWIEPTSVTFRRWPISRFPKVDRSAAPNDLGFSTVLGSAPPVSPSWDHLRARTWPAGDTEATRREWPRTSSRHLAARTIKRHRPPWLRFKGRHLLKGPQAPQPSSHSGCY